MSADSEAQPQATAAEPLLRVVHGNPDDAELGALICVFAALGSGGDDGAPAADASLLWRRQVPGWPPAPGPFAWRQSLAA